ncbi:uncharacterized protein LOC144556651 [Carex rostrata]
MSGITMGSERSSSPATEELQTQIEPKRPLMPHKLLIAATDGNKRNLNQLLGLNFEDDHPPDTKVSVDDVEPSDCLIRSANGMGDTILHILSSNGRGTLVAKICEKDSSLLKARNVRNETPFHQAARFGDHSTIGLLMRHVQEIFGVAEFKELIRQKNILGETALHEAARHGHVDVVSILMQASPELLGLVNDDSVSPLYLATARGSLHMVKMMVAKMLKCEITPAFYSGPKKMTALHAAVLQDRELTEELLQLYSEALGKGDETGRTPLHFAALTGKRDIAKLLLDKDPSLAYIQDSDGSFPIHDAVRMGHDETSALLLQMGVDSYQLLDGNGRNFLHIAVAANKTDFIFKLQNLKSKYPISFRKIMFNRMVNRMDNEGNTPFHLAAGHLNTDVMVYLLKNNELDLTLQNKKGYTAADIAMIQFRKLRDPTQRRDILGDFYIRNKGGRFSTGWFEEYISTTDERGAKKSSEILMAQAQFVGLGSVLIATVTFAAAFTLPGGTNGDTGTPILGRKYIFKAFVLADFCAFFYSFKSTMSIIYCWSFGNSAQIETRIANSMHQFTRAAKSMVIALALGLYLVIAPIGNIAQVVLGLSLFFALALGNEFNVRPQIEGLMLGRQILKYIPVRARGVNTVKPNYHSGKREVSYYTILMLMPMVHILIFIFLFALI